jgi:hypothetical protein
MIPLLTHEWRTHWRRGPYGGLAFLAVGLFWALVIHRSSWSAPSTERLAVGVAAGALITLGLMPFAALVLASRQVRREWRDGTVHLWLRFRPSEAERLLAKAMGALAVVATYVAAVLVASLLALAVLALLAPGQPLLLPLTAAPGLTGVLTAAVRWGIRDALLALAWAVPAVVLGLAAVFRPLRVSGRQGPWRGLTWALIWLVWVFLWAGGPLLPPILRLMRTAPEQLALAFLPAGPADIRVPIAPAFAVSLWPLILAWGIAAALFAIEVWWLRRRVEWR